MINFVPKKAFNKQIFMKYLNKSIESNQLSNYGPNVQLLEERARKMLKIPEEFEVIATCNGTTALHSIFWGFERQQMKNMQKAVQNFTFPASAQGPMSGAQKIDLDIGYNIDLGHTLMQKYAEIICITNLFGHLQELEIVVNRLKAAGKIVIFDNAATPYSFYRGINSCALADGSMVSLHHTKPIGYGEGGLAIIRKEIAPFVRGAINFGWVDGGFNERGSNYKMSELSAAGILQYWDSFDIDEMAKQYRENYFETAYKVAAKHGGNALPNKSDEEGFFPSNLPFIFNQPILPESIKAEVDVKKYYQPLEDLPVSTDLYARTLNFPIHEKYDI
jgi:dTDP-4-amino-4,6-dideoxygalactose transaminase